MVEVTVSIAAPAPLTALPAEIATFVAAQLTSADAILKNVPISLYCTDVTNSVLDRKI